MTRMVLGLALGLIVGLALGRAGGERARPATTALSSPGDARQATAVLERAVAAGEWNDEDAAELRRLLPALSRDDRAAAVTALMNALNAQRLRLATRHPI